MIIEKTVGYRVGEGKGEMFIASLEDAQRAAIRAIIYPPDAKEGSNDVADNIVKHREEVLAILSMKGPKVRKPRADKGKPRNKTAPTPATPAAGVKVEGSGKYAGR